VNYVSSPVGACAREVGARETAAAVPRRPAGTRARASPRSSTPPPPPPPPPRHRPPAPPAVPHDDPTLLFANAGMNQFKPIFLGQADPTGPLAPLKRAANTQKCIRAGGKHNDLDDVGKDTYHHTFFEMLGNWSFGDYFKEEAITWAWKLLTGTFGLNPDRLYATYFAGDAAFGLPADDEARNIWLRYLPAERILPFDKKANFWEMGDTGPCGPCSEIHYDRIGGRDASAMVNYDDPTVIEIWNIVFMQFNREPDGSLRELPAKHIDTGMGFERLTSILQGAMSNYDTDIFAPLFAAISDRTGARPYGGKLGADDAGGVDMAYRVVADHIRTLTFAVTDGAVPSNEGRGYVLRRILRRAVRYAQQKLGAKVGFFSSLVPVVVENFGDAFPELRGKAAFVQEVLRDEEESFSRTLTKGIKEFNARVADIKAKAGGASPAAAGGAKLVLPGADAFFLYDSMGFPLDLTALMAAEAGLDVDTDGFAACMAEQKARSQAAGKFARTTDRLVLEAEQTAWLAKTAGVKPTDDSAKYEWHAAAGPVSRVAAVFAGKERGFLTDGVAATPGAPTSTVGVLLESTSFYAESGGQVSDVGALHVLPAGMTKEDGEALGAPPASPAGVIDVADVQVFGGYVLHIGAVTAGSIKVGDLVRCAPDYERRGHVAPNHTMTHVLNYALREVVGNGLDQRGSTVEASKLRFDFSHGKGLTPAQLQAVEDGVNKVIDQVSGAGVRAWGYPRAPPQLPTQTYQRSRPPPPSFSPVPLPPPCRRCRCTARWSRWRRRAACTPCAPCLARRTLTPCASCPWAPPWRRCWRTRRTPRGWACPWSCAAARTSRTPAKRAASRCWRRAPSPRACAAWWPSRATPPSRRTRTPRSWRPSLPPRARCLGPRWTRGAPRSRRRWRRATCPRRARRSCATRWRSSTSACWSRPRRPPRRWRRRARRRRWRPWPPPARPARPRRSWRRCPLTATAGTRRRCSRRWATPTPPPRSWRCPPTAPTSCSCLRRARRPPWRAA
jgi:alanine--tRNA ligase